MPCLGVGPDVMRRGMDHAFKAEQRNQREGVQLQMRQRSLDKQKVKCRYLAGKRKRQIEAGVHQLFVTSGHSSQALPPDGPRDNAYKKSPYFSSTAESKIDEKRLLKWRTKERQFERTLQEENENLSPWDRQEKKDDNRRIWNQIAYIVENSHKGQDVFVNTESKPSSPETELNGTSKYNTNGVTHDQKYGRMNSVNSMYGSRPKSGQSDSGPVNSSNNTISIDFSVKDIIESCRRKQPLNVFQDLQNDMKVESDDNEMTMSKFAELSQPKPFSHKCWESQLIQNYTSTVTRTVKSPTLRGHYRHAQSVNTKTQETLLENDVENGDKIESPSQKNYTRTAREEDDQSSNTGGNTTEVIPFSTKHVDGRSQSKESDFSQAKTVTKHMVRPLSANGSNKKEQVGNMKRIKSAGTLRANSRVSLCEPPKDKRFATDTTGAIKIPQVSDVIDNHDGCRKLSSVTEMSGVERNEAKLSPEAHTEYSKNNAFSDQKSSQTSGLEQPKGKDSVDSRSFPKSKRNPSAKTRKSRPQKTLTRTKSDNSVASSLTRKTEDSKPANAKKKKKVVTKIKELAELYDDDMSDTDSDDLEQEALGVSERISQWRRDLMREAPPGIYSVNAPVRIRLAVSKAQLQKDYDRLVEEHSSDVRHITEKEKVRRLRSRMSVYMTMKIVEKAVKEENTGPIFE